MLPALPLPHPPVCPLRARKPIIGIAETEAITRMALERALRQNGYRVICASALAPHFCETPDLLVIGSWPVPAQGCIMAGFGLPAATPVIATTCGTASPFIAALYLEKPYDLSDLLGGVQKLLQASPDIR